MSLSYNTQSKRDHTLSHAHASSSDFPVRCSLFFVKKDNTHRKGTRTPFFLSFFVFLRPSIKVSIFKMDGAISLFPDSEHFFFSQQTSIHLTRQYSRSSPLGNLWN